MDNGSGDLSALRQLMTDNGMDAGILAQQSQNSPVAKPNVLPSQAPQGGGLPQPQGAIPTGTEAQPLPQESPEAATIIKALSARLSTLGKMGR